MDDEQRDQLLSAMIEQPQGRERLLREANLNELEVQELTDLLQTADSVWLASQGAPPLSEDPVAAMLGLVPNSECTLNPGALSRARRRSRLTVSEVAERLRERGWGFSKSDVFRWENRGAADVPPAVIQAIAETLGAQVQDLIASRSAASASDILSGVRNNPLFDQLVERWARLQRVSRAVALASLEGRALATVHRGEQPDEEQLLRSLEALVSSLEHGKR